MKARALRGLLALAGVREREMALLPADSVIGLKDGESGMVSFFKEVVLRAEDERRVMLGRTNGEGGTSGADVAVREGGAAMVVGNAGGARRLDALAEWPEKLAALGG